MTINRINYTTISTSNLAYVVTPEGDILGSDGKPYGGEVFQEHANIAALRKKASSKAEKPEEAPAPSLEYLKSRGHEKKPLLRAIREKCLDCSYTPSEVRLCTCYSCPLWPYRMGTNPFHTRDAGKSKGDDSPSDKTPE